MNKTIRTFLILISTILFAGFLGVKNTPASDEYPQNNAWYQAAPSVVWCGDPDSTTTLEVHIVGRKDVARVWLTDLGTAEDEERDELFDDGSHGDSQTGDNIFTLNNVIIPCDLNRMPNRGWRFWVGFLRVELANGTEIGNNYGLMIGLVDPKYKDTFEITELGPDLTATAYALFIQDSANLVIDNYPIASVYCGTRNFAAYQKLYTVLPDAFDFAVVMPGSQIFRPDNLAENVPYNVLVSNQVQHIGIDIMDDSAKFGSSGRLKSTIYLSFASSGVFDHEIAHAWGAAIGQSLGLLSPRYTYDVNQGHWNENADMEGQLGAYYFDSTGAVGHFSYRGDNAWTLISNSTVEPYSPLELYTMGLIPPDEVPPIHILTSPDTSNPNLISAGSNQTITIDDIITSEGGARVPNSVDSQKDFNLAFIVTQDHPYTDAAYAFFSLISYQFTSQAPPEQYSSFGTFYWATGGRATLETRLPLDLSTGLLPGQPEPVVEPTQTIEVLKTPPAEDDGLDAAPTPSQPTAPSTPVEEPNPVADAPPEAEEAPGCSLLPVGLIVLPGILAQLRSKKRSNGGHEPKN